MKKLMVYVTAIVAIFALLFIVKSMSVSANDADAKRLYKVSASKLNSLTVAQLKDPNYQNIVLPDDIDTKMKNKEPMFVYFFKSDCEHCMVTTPVLYPLTKEMNINLMQLNLLEFPDGWTKYKIEGTPTLVYYKDGKEVDRLVGENTKEKFTEFLTKYKG